jgi:hypothetical protein
MCEESFELRTVRQAVIAQTKAIAEHPEDGPIYEDGFLIITRAGGKVIYTPKPLRIPIQFKRSH